MHPGLGHNEMRLEPHGPSTFTPTGPAAFSTNQALNANPLSSWIPDSYWTPASLGCP